MTVRIDKESSIFTDLKCSLPRSLSYTKASSLTSAFSGSKAVLSSFSLFPPYVIQIPRLHLKGVHFPKRAPKALLLDFISTWLLRRQNLDSDGALSFEPLLILPKSHNLSKQILSLTHQTSFVLLGIVPRERFFAIQVEVTQNRIILLHMLEKPVLIQGTIQFYNHISLEKRTCDLGILHKYHANSSLTGQIWQHCRAMMARK